MIHIMASANMWRTVSVYTMGFFLLRYVWKFECVQFTDYVSWLIRSLDQLQQNLISLLIPGDLLMSKLR